MSAELAPIITVTRASAIIKTVSGNIVLPYSEPCSWTVELDNSTGLYGLSSSIADVRANEMTYCQITVDDAGTWTSPDLVVEDWEYDTDAVSVSGRCRLSQLDRDDQVIEVADGISTAENKTVAELLTLLATHCGLTVTGAPTRKVREFNLVGNPLQLFRDLLEPTEVFRMGVGGEIVVSSATTHTMVGTLTDVDDLEILKFRRTTDINNKATVERLVPQGTYEVLFDESRSGGGELGPTANGPHALTKPSREFQFTIKQAYRGKVIGIQLRDEAGDPVGGSPFLMAAYVGVTPVHSFTFVYDYNLATASDWGPWTANWHIQIQGRPADEDPVPVENYSETSNAGAGDRPYSEPFSSVAIDTAIEAKAAADALVEKGTRIGNILNCATRVRSAKIWRGNDGMHVTDHHSGLDRDVVIEAGSLAWSEDGDTGTMSYDCTFSEVS